MPTLVTPGGSEGTATGRARPPRRSFRKRRALALLAGLALAGATLTGSVGPANWLDSSASGSGVVAPAPPHTLGDACPGDAPAKVGGGTWRCTWSDEFEGTELTDTWSLIPYGLGSACLFNDAEHVRVADGALQLVANPLPDSHYCTQQWGLEYGGGGVQSQGRFAQQYGRFEVRAKLPAGRGLWPQIWLLPDDNSYSGEIDMMEIYGGRDNLADATLHVPAGGPGPQGQCPIQPDYSSDYHTYALEWTKVSMRFLYDGVQCVEFVGLSGDGRSPPLPSVFDRPYHVLLDLALQPWWPADATTPFPAVMYVDYVRAWE